MGCFEDFFDRSHDIIRKQEGMQAGWVIHRGKLWFLPITQKKNRKPVGMSGHFMSYFTLDFRVFGETPKAITTVSRPLKFR